MYIRNKALPLRRAKLSYPYCGNRSGGIGLKEIANRIVERLRSYFEKRTDIVMAFLFGSWAKGHEGAESYIDIAVYFRQEGKCPK